MHDTPIKQGQFGLQEGCVEDLTLVRADKGQPGLFQSLFGNIELLAVPADLTPKGVRFRLEVVKMRALIVGLILQVVQVLPDCCAIRPTELVMLALKYRHIIREGIGL